jgi:DNA replication and repair protein RecF
LRATELFAVVDRSGTPRETMLIRKLTLRHFRNVPLASLRLEGARQFLVGSNGQGKTNLIEAAGFLTALRSFRTPESRHLIMHGQPEAGIACEVEREGSGAESVAIRIRGDGKGLWRNERRVTRLADHLGQFPTVVFSSEDLQLVRGAPGLRRRWLDLTLSAMDPGYLSALQAYGAALAARNSLLRRRDAGAAGELAAFERALAPAGSRIMASRAAGVAELAAAMGGAYGRLCAGSEEATLGYEPSCAAPSAEGLLAELAAGRARDLQAGVTLSGPHRDDIRFLVRGSAARDFASEGQQRSAVLALRLAQAAWFRARSGVTPVLLADDILGELDDDRRGRFWSALDPGAQVIATGTRPPPGTGGWQLFSVAGGAFSPEAGAMEATG